MSNQLLIKIAGLVCVVFISSQSQAQAEPENMLLKLQEMQNCMATIDITKVQQLEQSATKLREEVRALCAAGDAQQAQAKAMAFGNQVAASETVRLVAKCAEIMQGMIPELSLADFEKNFTTINICDGSL